MEPFESVKAACPCYCLVSSFHPYPDPSPGLEFPWGPKPFSEVVAGPLLRNNGQTLDSSALEGSHVGVYFSAHWVSRRCWAEQLGSQESKDPRLVGAEEFKKNL